MRTIITTIVLAITMLYTGQAQTTTYTEYGNWSVTDQTITDENLVWAGADGTIISGNQRTKDGRKKSPLLVYMQKLSTDGTQFIARYAIGYTNYGYDSTGNKNFVEVDLIFDGNKNSMITYEGEVYNQNGFVRLSKEENGDETNKIYTGLRSAKTVHVRIRVGDRTDFVYKFNINGFTQVDTHGEKVLKSTSVSNPFADAGDDPFRG